jgi:AraC-like DNA-binding protein
MPDLNFNLYYPTQPYYQGNLSFRSSVFKKQNSLWHIIAEFYELRSDGNPPRASSFIPDACVDITFQYGSDKLIGFVCGSYATKIKVYRERYDRLFGVRFHPGAAPFVLGMSADQLIGRHYLFESSIMRLMEDATTFSERMRVMENYLLDRIRAERPLLLDYCIYSIVKHYNGLSIRDLSESTGYSDRYIRKLFDKYVGFSPKVFYEIIRFQRAVTFLETTRLSKCEVAHRCGYSDQSHMNRAFRRFSGENNLLNVHVRDTLEID